MREFQVQLGVQVPDFRFGAAVLGNIADGARYQSAFFGMKRAEADFDWEFRSVLATTKELQSNSHRTRVGRLGVTVSVLRMPGAEALRDKEFDRLSEHLFPGVLEESFCLRVNKMDSTGGVRD